VRLAICAAGRWVRLGA